MQYTLSTEETPLHINAARQGEGFIPQRGAPGPEQKRKM